MSNPETVKHAILDVDTANGEPKVIAREHDVVGERQPGRGTIVVIHPGPALKKLDELTKAKGDE